MTRTEVIEWLGFEPGFPLHDSIADGMADVPVPVTDADQVAAFRQYLKVSKS